MATTKIIVLDDDPTGSQTVHSCLLLLQWTVPILKQALQDPAPLFFILTNTRGMTAEAAAQLTRQVCQALREALQQLAREEKPINPLVVSRSDSTLRGHYPVETDVIAEELGPFAAHFLIPAFFEGGRITRDSTHYLRVKGEWVPTHLTEFAKDSVFGYSTAYLPDYVAEKTHGKIPASQVTRWLLPELRGGVAELRTRLMALRDNQCGVVDAETQADLDQFCQQIQWAAAQGQRFLFRSAASWLTSLAQLPPQPVDANAMAQYVRLGRPGVVLVGSHVPTTTQQLQHLCQQPGVVAIEVAVDEIATQGATLLTQLNQHIAQAHDQNLTPVIYTSREERQFADQATRLAFGEQVSQFLMAIVQQLPVSIGFLISKGGITSNETLSRGLALATARVVGQIHAGCSVVLCPADHPRFPGLPVVIFPGNVGDAQALSTVYHRLHPAD